MKKADSARGDDYDLFVSCSLGPCYSGQCEIRPSWGRFRSIESGL